MALNNEDGNTGYEKTVTKNSGKHKILQPPIQSSAEESCGPETGLAIPKSLQINNITQINQRE